MRQRLWRRTEGTEMLRRLKQDDQKQLDREQEKRIKGPFTYDAAGNIMAVNPVRGDKLPAQTTNVKFSLPVTPCAVAPVKKQLRKQSSPAPTAIEWVKNLPAAQPTVFEHTQPRPGVTITEGSQVKSAAQVPSQTMCRAEYQRRAHTKGKRPVSGTADPPKTQLSPSVVPVRDSFERIPEYELCPGEPLRSRRRASRAQQNKVTQYSKDGRGRENTSPFGLFNLEIIRDRNWGVNPPVKQTVLPRKPHIRPSSNTHRQTHGDRLKKPSDQPFLTPRELWDLQAHKLKKSRERRFPSTKRECPAPPGPLVSFN